jgi:GNAT superfamily N-acetyltransferase
MFVSFKLRSYQHIGFDSLHFTLLQLTLLSLSFLVLSFLFFSILYFTYSPFYFWHFYFLPIFFLHVFLSFPGEVEGFLGVVRFLGVLPRYHGLCIGRRLICRVEEIMMKKGCVRCMCCIPDPRSSMADWVNRRGEGESVGNELRFDLNTVAPHFVNTTS